MTVNHAKILYKSDIKAFMKEKWKLIPNIYNAVLGHKYPLSLIQFVTERCNARCPHCFVDNTKQREELKLEDIEKIAKTSGPCLRNIALTGGEPFLRDDLFEIADIWNTNSAACSISITTNGSFPSRIEEFVKKSVKKNLPVSFFFSYDFIGEKHSEYRKLKDLHLNVIESYEIIKKYSDNINATFQITLNQDNFSSAFETYKYMRDTLKIQNINCTMLRGEKAEKLSLDERNKIAQVYELIQSSMDKDFDCSKITGFKGDFLTSSVINAKNKIMWKYILSTFTEKKFLTPCQAGSLFGVIYSDGSVFPCELLNLKAGNLKDYDFDFLKCWSSMDADKIRKQIKSSKCFCTFECSWLVNLISSPKYTGELMYASIKNQMRKKE